MGRYKTVQLYHYLNLNEIYDCLRELEFLIQQGGMLEKHGFIFNLKKYKNPMYMSKDKVNTIKIRNLRKYIRCMEYITKVMRDIVRRDSEYLKRKRKKEW